MKIQDNTRQMSVNLPRSIASKNWKKGDQVIISYDEDEIIIRKADAKIKHIERNNPKKNPNRFYANDEIEAIVKPKNSTNEAFKLKKMNELIKMIIFKRIPDDHVATNVFIQKLRKIGIDSISEFYDELTMIEFHNVLKSITCWSIPKKIKARKIAKIEDAIRSNY